MLSEPASSLTDLALGLVTLWLAVRLQRMPDVHRFWKLTFWWAAAAALAGAVHHGFVTYSDRWAGPSWAVISTMVVITVSYLLAASVEEVLGPGHARAFWVLRSVGLIAYIALAVSGRAGVGAILLCEGLTMICVLALWGKAAHDRNPLAGPVILAIAASGAAAGLRAAPGGVAGLVGLDPTSLYHLAQIPGMVLLYAAVSGMWGAHREAPAPAAGHPATQDEAVGSRQ
jgi:hypothetical protein